MVGPRLEKPARYSPSSVSLGTGQRRRVGRRADGDHVGRDAGEEMVPGASPSLPAAATTTLPAATAASAAWLPASEPSEPGLPSDIEITSTSARAAHHSIAETTSASSPKPLGAQHLRADQRGTAGHAAVRRGAGDDRLARRDARDVRAVAMVVVRRGGAVVDPVLPADDPAGQRLVVGVDAGVDHADADAAAVERAVGGGAGGPGGRHAVVLVAGGVHQPRRCR